MIRSSEGKREGTCAALLQHTPPYLPHRRKNTVKNVGRPKEKPLQKRETPEERNVCSSPDPPSKRGKEWQGMMRGGGEMNA